MGEERMLKKNIEHCIELTDRILSDHYRANSDLLMEHIDENCLWIGSCDSEYYRGKETIMEVLNKWRGNLPLITLISKEFTCVTHDRHSCTISGRYIGVTDEDSGEIFSDRQRVTFSWKEKAGSLRLMHIHLSNPLKNLRDDEVFPHEIGMYTKEYMHLLIRKEMDAMGAVIVKDINNITYKISVGKIIYFEAFNMKTLIHTMEGDILAKMPLSELKEQLVQIEDNPIVRIHKSFCVNRFYVESIQRYELQLRGGYRVPVSRNFYTVIKEKLELNGA